MSTFGQLFRTAREQAGFHTIRAFADEIVDIGIELGEDTISKWETDVRSPYHRDALRERFLTILQFLANRGGITQKSEVDAMLLALGRLPLTTIEQVSYFPQFGITIPNLPEKPYYVNLIGRTNEIEEIQTLLTDTNGQRIVVLSGLGGIGKTAIAYEVIVAVMLAKHFDLLLYATLQSEKFIATSIQQVEESHLDLDAVLETYARQAGLLKATDSFSEATADELKRYLASGRCLLVLDNLETLNGVQDAARKLNTIIGVGHSRLLITSRKRLLSESYLVDYYIKGLPESASRRLIQEEAVARLADGLLEADDDLLHQMYTTTGGMPLALKLLVTQFLLGIPLDEELGRLQGVMDEEQIYTYIYFAIWEKLSDFAISLLIAVATYANPVTRPFVQPLSELDDTHFNKAIPELVRASLLEVSNAVIAVNKTYDVHAMTRWFVNAPLAQLWEEQRDSDL